MINIKKIEVTGYRLLEDTSLDFTNRKGLVSLKGINKDFFESNGSGKSTLPNAICQTIYGENLEKLPQKDINSIYSGTKFRGYIELEIKGQKVEIERDYGKGTFDFWIDGICDGVANKKTKQDRLDRVIGLSFDTFSKLFYLSPSRISLFSKSDDATQGKFIKELLSLEFISNINKRAELELKLLKSETDIKVKEQEMNEKQLSYINDQLELIKSTTFDVKQLYSLKEKLEEVTFNKEKQQKELKQFKTLVAQKKNEYDSLVAERKIRKESIAEQERIGILDTCPTCKQKIKNKGEISEWITGEETKSKELTININQVFGEYSRMVSSEKALEKGLQESVKKEILLESDIKRIEEIQKAGDSNSKTLMKKKLIKDSEEITARILQQEVLLKTFRDKIYVLELIKASTSSNGFVKERINLFIELMNNQLSKLSTDVLGGEASLVIIRNEKNSYEVLLQDSNGKLSYSQMSQGTKNRVDILLVLALNGAIKMLTNIEINMIFLDEIFSNVDMSGKKDIEILLKKLSVIYPDKIFVSVLHGGDIESQDSILVTRLNNRSKLSWA